MFEVASFLFGLAMCVFWVLCIIGIVVCVILSLIETIRDFRD